MKKKAEVAIIGGGINGCAIAYHLAKHNIDTILLEKKYLTSGATGACGAGIRQQWSTKENTTMAIQSVKLFEQLNTELNTDIEFTQGGYLIAIHTKKEHQQAQKNVTMQQTLGLDVSIIPPETIQTIAPQLDIHAINAQAATFCPTDGHANPFKTTFAYAKAAEKHGADINTYTKVTKINTQKNHITSINTTNGTIKTDTIVNAAGIWSKPLADKLNISLPNQPLRKEIIVTERLQPLFKPMIISFTDGIYFSQQPEGHIVGGIPIPDETPGYKTMPTFTFLTHMAQTLTKYVPQLKHVNLLRHWTGFYDMTPDARPILGPIPQIHNFYQCHGFSGHGFMLAPIVSKLIADAIITQKEPNILTNLSAERFKNKTPTSKETSVVG